MKLRLYSDIHFEFGNESVFFDDYDASDIDVLLLAGDIITKGHLNVLERFYTQGNNPDLHVVYVPGNHEYYGSEFNTMQFTLRDHCKQLPNFHFLENEVLHLHNQRFVGGTMWYGRSKAPLYSPFMNDFKQIWVDHEPIDMFLHTYSGAAEQWFNQNIQEGDVVITHVPPSESTLTGVYNPSLNMFYYRNMEQTIMDKKPKLWVSGHSHSSYDGMIGNTRIVRNPHGYYNYAENHTFKKDLIIEI